jgi:hypothetical protein
MYDSLQLLRLFLVPKELSKFRVLIPMGFTSRLLAVFVRVLETAPSAIRVSERFLLSFRTAVVKSSKLPGSNVYLSFLLFFFLKMSSDRPENHQFFHETWWFFEVLETTRNNGSFILISA